MRRSLSKTNKQANDWFLKPSFFDDGGKVSKLVGTGCQLASSRKCRNKQVGLESQFQARFSQATSKGLSKRVSRQLGAFQDFPQKVPKVVSRSPQFLKNGSTPTGRW
mmetsp:Transcript_87037/g.191222  ORF Transcript_87037/g.191222 Transcript_87037/m.191222 type:complete len:107 (-) Transcript_87037:697-1017(-)